jgi:hypothetical protein
MGDAANRTFVWGQLDLRLGLRLLSGGSDGRPWGLVVAVRLARSSRRA